MQMRLFSILFIALFVCSTQSIAQSGAPEFCAELSKLGKIDQFGGNDRLFYRDAWGAIREVVSGHSIPRNINYLYYFVRSQPEQEKKKGVINLKFVYFTAQRPNRKSLVGLSNDRWTESQGDRSRAACANLTVEGYDNYHLYRTSNVCLTYHFHQADPNTLDTSDHRRSFAFGEMIPGSTPGFLSIFWPPIQPARASAVGDNSTIRNTLARSWIRNFVHQKGGSCVRIQPNIPPDATTLNLHVVNHSNLQEYPWLIGFEN